MLLYTTENSPRLKYICEFISAELFTSPITITVDRDAYSLASGFKINYSDERITSEEYFIKPFGILSEDDILAQKIECSTWNGVTIFFTSDGDLPFDILSAIFYLISRYEEYLPHSVDEYGRYDHKQSLAFQQNFLDQPLVNKWLLLWKQILSQKFAGISFKKRAFKFLPSYDIDMAWKYQHKGWLRTVGGLMRSLFKLQWNDINERFRVLDNKKPDPFDCYVYLHQLHDRYQLDPYYFFLLAERNGRNDKNISPFLKSMQDLVAEHASRYKLGIHPSWQSGDDQKLLCNEISLLEKYSSKKVIASRQHYIRMSLPLTYQNLLSKDIELDFSMGYGGINGFRASTCSIFKWFDVFKNETTALTVFPFCFMEATSFYELHHSPEEALKEMKNYYHEIKSVNGLYCMIWHNSFLGSDKMYKGWRQTYETFLEYLHSHESSDH